MGNPRGGRARSGGRRPRLGQHFLADPLVLDRIIASLPDDGLPLIEIGAGAGVLTERLAALDRPLTAVELDDYWADRTTQRLAPHPHVTLVHGDILDLPIADLLAAATADDAEATTTDADAAPPYAVVGNLPYAITAMIFRKFLSDAPVRPRWMLVMVQREVAEQIVAGPGKRSMLSIAVQLYGEPRLLFPVPPEAFQPPPRVHSAVVFVPVGAAPRVSIPSEERFWEVVRAGFRAPRKQLHNALSMGLWLPEGGAREWLTACGIDPQRRPGTLSLEEWATLAWARERGVGAPPDETRPAPPPSPSASAGDSA